MGEGSLILLSCLKIHFSLLKERRSLFWISWKSLSSTSKSFPPYNKLKTVYGWRHLNEAPPLKAYFPMVPVGKVEGDSPLEVSVLPCWDTPFWRCHYGKHQESALPFKYFSKVAKMRWHELVPNRSSRPEIPVIQVFELLFPDVFSHCPGSF